MGKSIHGNLEYQEIQNTKDSVFIGKRWIKGDGQDVAQIKQKVVEPTFWPVHWCVKFGSKTWHLQLTHEAGHIYEMQELKNSNEDHLELLKEFKYTEVGKLERSE